MVAGLRELACTEHLLHERSLRECEGKSDAALLAGRPISTAATGSDSSAGRANSTTTSAGRSLSIAEFASKKMGQVCSCAST